MINQGKTLNLKSFFFLIILIYSLLPAFHGSNNYSGTVFGDEESVIIIEIKGTIDPGMYNYVQRSLNNAISKGAPTVFLILNTPGGYINTALDIREIMDSYPGKINAYVQHQAISAGAYLALASDAIYLSPGSSIGAAEPRGLTGESVDEKSLSFWEGAMRTLAKRNQRDPDIAAAMVRSEIEIEGLVEKGKLLTLTSEEALDYGYSEGTYESLNALLDTLGLGTKRIVESKPTFFDTIISWSTNPLIATLLLAIGIGGIVLELFTLGFGIAGIVGLSSFALYYSSHILGGLAGYEVIFFFLVGIVLLLIEAFIPGLGVFGIGGALSVSVSIVLAASTLEAGIAMLLGSMFLSGLVSFFSLRLLSRKGVLRKIILEDSATKEQGYTSSPSMQDFEGREGITLTALRPSGTVDIDGKRVDAVSEGQYIVKNAKVKVVKIEGIRVVVREVTDSAG